MLGEERAVLDHWLDLYRGTVLLKIAGLDAALFALAVDVFCLFAPPNRVLSDDSATGRR